MCSITQKKLCDSGDCEVCNPRRFSSHPKSVFWDKDKNDIDPKYVMLTSNEKLVSVL